MNHLPYYPMYPMDFETDEKILAMTDADWYHTSGLQLREMRVR